MDEHHNYFVFVVVITLFVTLIIFSIGSRNGLDFVDQTVNNNGLTGNVISENNNQVDNRGVLSSSRVIFPTERYDVLSCFDDGTGNVVIEISDKEVQMPIEMELSSAKNEKTGSSISYECKAFKVIETETITK